jgi:class 3 adenylate cyclase/tetratricopeptide (TPR) repeat protein
MADTTAAIESAIAALEAQRHALGSAVVDAALVPLQRELQRLRAQPEPELPREQLKQVSVLFVDVVGSTAIGQRLNPEEIHVVMDGALARFTTAVKAHHGRVLKYIGDGMLAAFGTETVSEDDAESAVRSGLAVLDAAREHAAFVQREFGIVDFNVRAGVHTGRVLLGGGVDAEDSIHGATVNIAARMEQSAPYGTLRISHETWRQVRGLFETSEMEAVQVKGVEEPLRTYLVERARPHAFSNPTRGVDGIVTRMVGRNAELAALDDAFAHASYGRRLAAVTVVGEPGIGKSRLLAEFRAKLDEADPPCRLLLARAHPRSALHPYGQLRDLFAWTLGIEESDAAPVARDKFVQALAPLFAAEGEAPVHALGQLIGLDFSDSRYVQELLANEERLREQAFNAASLALRRLAEVQDATVVLLIDDLHWADDGSRDFAHYLLAHNRDMPLLAVFLTRPALFEREPEWAAGDGAHRRLDIPPLDAVDRFELAAGLLQRIANVPDALRSMVTGSADGNPFYMEELVKMLVDEGVIVDDGESWRVLSERLHAAKVPASLTGVLQARLDALPARERLALQQAAIVGHVFWVEALAAVDAAAIDALPALLRRQLVLPREHHTGEGAGEYVFQHQLLQQVAYDGVLQAPRLDWHARVGAFWQARAEVGGRERVDSTAMRALAEAHDHCRRSDPKAFAVWFDGQFTTYLNAYVGRSLRPLAESVLHLCERHYGSHDRETARALTNLARLELQQRDTAGAGPLLERALAIQQSQFGDDHPDTARTLGTLGAFHSARGASQDAEPYFRRALDVRSRVLGTEDPLTLGIMDHLAGSLIELGRIDEAEPLLRQVLEVRERTCGDQHADTASAMTALSDVLIKRGELGQAEALLGRALAVQERTLGPDNPDVGLTLWHLAETLRRAGRATEAEPLARRTLKIVQTAFSDDHEWAAWALSLLAELRLAQGDAAEAAVLAERAQAIFERHFGATYTHVGSMLALRGRAALEAGDAASAVPLLERSLSIEAARSAGGGARGELVALLERAQQTTKSSEAG